MQVLLTRVRRLPDGSDSFEDHSFNYDPKRFFYAASLVKLPLAIMALHKLNSIDGVDRNTRLRILPQVECMKIYDSDTVSTDGFPNLRTIIQKALIVSDDKAYNALVDICGRKYINSELLRWGWDKANIHKKYGACDTLERAMTHKVQWLDQSGGVIYSQEKEEFLQPRPFFAGEIKKGLKHENEDGDIVDGPYDFTEMNFIPLEDLHRLMQALVFPERNSELFGKLGITKEQAGFLVKTMSTWAGEMPQAFYHFKTFTPSWSSYIINGDQKVRPFPGVTVCNKVGMSHGFISDVAWITQEKTGVRFFMSANMYVNSNQTVNDGKYDYLTVGLPFMARLGRAVLAKLGEN